ncbi:F0F1 ATP synthase subunit B [Olsenella profusa]|uniref:ATP synthase subunit b n=1 Tax=Olsenella profusa F0195 TaxID=1125712 RepID=U2TSG4_9ACTN|nr:F0F1 ATP synthase subunit B [Olsenella profusa]ERL09295.1 ATP synthase F0, B subunit [Olsenella profusa F0195]
MDRNMKGLGRVGAAALASAAMAMQFPTVALADSPSGTDLLLPKPAEFVPALIAFLVIWAVLAKFALPSIVEMMEKRQQKIQNDLDEAQQAKVKAVEEQKEYEARIAEAHRQAERIIADAKREAEEERSRVLAKAQRDAAGVIAKAHGAVSSERKKAMIELSGQVVNLSVEIASKIIGNDLSEDEQRRLAERYLAEVSTRDDR